MKTATILTAEGQTIEIKASSAVLTVELDNEQILKVTTDDAQDILEGLKYVLK